MGKKYNTNIELLKRWMLGCENLSKAWVLATLANHKISDGIEQLIIKHLESQSG